MRKIKGIIVHCTASSQVPNLFHLYFHWIAENGWQRAGGYHKVVLPDGTVSTLAGDRLIVNGAQGYNTDYLHIAYMGGAREDDRTPEQKEALVREIRKWQDEYDIPNSMVKPHYAVNPLKHCPHYDPRVETVETVEKKIVKAVDNEEKKDTIKCDHCWVEILKKLFRRQER